MKKVMVFGTFDIFHPGHLNFFRQAKKKGDYLIAVVARDKNVLKIKNRSPKHNEIERLNQLKVIGEIDKVVLGNIDDQYKIIKVMQPDVICLGYDQGANEDELRKNFPNIEFYRLQPYKEKIYKSSKLLNNL